MGDKEKTRNTKPQASKARVKPDKEAIEKISQLILDDDKKRKNAKAAAAKSETKPATVKTEPTKSESKKSDTKTAQKTEPKSAPKSEDKTEKTDKAEKSEKPSKTVLETTKIDKKITKIEVTELEDEEVEENEEETNTTSETVKKSAATSKSTASTSQSTNTKPAKSKAKKNMKLPRVRIVHFKIRYVIIAAILLAGTIFFGRVAAWEKNYLETMVGSERHTTETKKDEPAEVYEGGEQVDSTPPSTQQVAEYHVAANRPRYISIPLLNIRNARVVEVGQKSNNELDTPRNIYNVGWYNKMALPGQPGVTVMDAHGGDMGNGIFRYLPRISVGDEIQIEMGDEQTIYTYVVKEVATKAIGEEANNYMSTAFQPLRAGSSTLTLITCTGDWSQKQQTYSHRFFVRAELKQ